MAPIHYLKPPVRLLSFGYLVAPPLVLAVLFWATLFAHSNVEVALLWSQCHARERLPVITRVPLVGTPSCFLVSFLGAARESRRGRAKMAEVLALLGPLVTVSWLEGRRACNAGARMLARPAAAWLAFTLLGPAGGATTWLLAVVPAFIRRARSVYLGEEGDRTLPDSHVVAVPVAVALGFYVPSALLLFVDSPAAPAVWLLFPFWVSLVQRAARAVVGRVQRSERPAMVLLERHWQAVAVVYALPILVSVAAHAFFLSDLLAGRDDRKKMGSLTSGIVEINAVYVLFGLLYWMFVEAGWRLPLVMVGVSVILGPGAGVCVAWLYRESLVRHGFGPEEEEDHESNEEETPLLR